MQGIIESELDLGDRLQITFNEIVLAMPDSTAQLEQDLVAAQRNQRDSIDKLTQKEFELQGLKQESTRQQNLIKGLESELKNSRLLLNKPETISELLKANVVILAGLVIGGIFMLICAGLLAWSFMGLGKRIQSSILQYSESSSRTNAFTGEPFLPSQALPMQDQSHIVEPGASMPGVLQISAETIKAQLVELNRELSSIIDKVDFSLVTRFVRHVIGSKNGTLDAIFLFELLGTDRSSKLFFELSQEERRKIAKTDLNMYCLENKYQKMLSIGENLKTVLLTGSMQDNLLDTMLLSTFLWTKELHFGILLWSRNSQVYRFKCN